MRLCFPADPPLYFAPQSYEYFFREADKKRNILLQGPHVDRFRAFVDKRLREAGDDKLAVESWLTKGMFCSSISVPCVAIRVPFALFSFCFDPGCCAFHPSSLICQTSVVTADCEVVEETKHGRTYRKYLSKKGATPSTAPVAAGAGAGTASAAAPEKAGEPAEADKGGMDTSADN